jgi:L-lactate dehydrogenase complex protein LldG
VAERGTLVLESSPGHGRAIDVVSMYHLAVLPASRLRATLAEALTEAYAGGRAPSAVSLVSAPSRTSDIEKISTLGAHGAKGLHLLVVQDR